MTAANAAPWSMALKEAYMRDFGEESLWEVYGSTELGVDTVLGPGDHRKRPGSCGRALPSVEIRLFAEDGHEITEPEVPGEVFVKSPNTFVGYYKAEAATGAARRGDFASVGDVAYRDTDGFYYICDRKSDMIISGGMNIYPAEIEAVLERHPDIADVAVFGIPSEEWGESVHAVVVARPGRAPGNTPAAHRLPAQSRPREDWCLRSSSWPARRNRRPVARGPYLRLRRERPAFQVLGRHCTVS